MIGISKLFCGAVEPSDALRYGRESGQLPSHLLQFSKDKKPVVVWNMTQRCNLKCVHCYAQAVDPSSQKDPISNEKAKEIIDDLAQFGAPVMLFSGGEPLVREDLVDLAKYATSKGMRAVISTNGTLITKSKARELKEVGLSYVGISLDGAEEVHDKFRGVKGSYKQALKGVENCQAEGLKVGLRFTINKRNVQGIPHLFDLIEQLEVPRICFYHLVYSGRGSELMKEDLDHAETRQAVDLIMDRTRALFDKGLPKEVLTVDNHADGPYLYYRMLKEDPARAADVLELLKMNEGNSSGRGIGCISWDGKVHADQFMRHITFGNVLERPFSEIWTDPNIELLHKLKDKRPHVKGRCATCRFLNICGGNFRARAEAVYDDFWAQDPACYLTDEEITGEKL
ncbi:MAG: 12,18-didecarboxysiroheme deacetylase [Pseudodesulfovibrio sp.]|uniref:Pre-heme d1 synthase n=1 Tax=Pseudodesulfovibrio aespoeensis (strain ATCC 700646 / DSM 10631 / Aspo-2) TaxID=643562 RepID=E6VSW6_PSEA9|nr:MULTISPECIES: 12,18-didecarboxysiroheme deacetylase [Pseudodesulfovibrio]MBU4192483.1 12,18-didecarboxysiroheme deacetylase [Pseudomonadota bacterium]ADU63210.1 Radical SAM domain protein [Pseudodesulfovibrio aespoeensis Aspo-2]MBU4243274.1 12,18-didecarboxysiroheme deacetylase [Pseudomonadota bacterium]MBU4379159.1 12,18-didecarboxysiroheme deacetylase [Pseudomonadota bacterium]MBU4475107.1 12,18-didecarboxysiroheme deacetylase [Pseudomonadota bacterium]